MTAGSEEANPWRDALHAAMPVSDKALLARDVLTATGEEPVRWDRIVAGQKSEVYAVTLASGHEAIVRISRRGDCRFESERWALKTAKEAGVPAPEMLHLEQHEDEHGSLWVCVESRVPGRSLDRVTDAADLERLVGDAGEILGLLHRVSVEGFGFVQPDGGGPFDSFARSMTELQTEEELALAVERGATLGIPEKWIRAGSAELRRHDDLFDAMQPRLLHGDVSLGHFFTDGTAITGLLDFEDAAGGDPALDFIWWNYFREECPCRVADRRTQPGRGPRRRAIFASDWADSVRTSSSRTSSERSVTPRAVRLCSEASPTRPRGSASNSS